MMKAVLLATLCILAVLSSINQVLPQETRLETVFVQGGEKFPVRVEQVRFAVILAEKVASDEGSRRVTMESLKAAPIAGFPDNIVSVPVEGTNDAKALTEMARRLRSGRGSEIAASGVIAYIGTSDSPFVITDQIIIQVEKDGKFAEDVAAKFGAKIITKNPYDRNQFVIELPADSKEATLDVSNAINEIPGIVFAHPNFYRVVELRQTPFIPNDPFFANQWHLNNTGQSGGTADADIDADLAWSFTQGSNAIVIAVIDNAFEANHPDLQPNLWINPGEIAGDGIDNDGNGYIDDVNGWNFTSCNGNSPCGDADISPPAVGNSHGTAVAGAAVARGNNVIGVSGSCPQCRFMPIKQSGTVVNVFADGLAFGYAQAQGAHIISNSWGYPVGTMTTGNVVTAINNAATSGRGGLGSVVLFAMSNDAVDDCNGMTPDISSLSNVIAVSRVTNQNRFSSGGFGNCMDVLGPTSGGTLSGVTTDRQGTTGFNNTTRPLTCPASITEPANNRDYTFCFDNTSFATPVVAGEAGLLLSLDNMLTRQQVQRVIQDTADKIEDSLGAYSESTGFSATPDGVVKNLGFGRVNAFEAVRLLAPRSAGGHGGTDIFIRDNRLDWGNTEKLSSYTFEQAPGFMPHWQSVDTKVDAPPYRATPPVTAAEFDGFAHENPLSNTLNKVYVRVHNRGPRAATNVTIKLHWAFAGVALPTLPGDFWTAFPGDATDTSIWHPIGTASTPSLAYSGASVAGSAADPSFIATFDFNAPVFDATQAAPEHYCLFAVIGSDEDPVSSDPTMPLAPDDITPADNNVTQLNVQLIDSSPGGRADTRLIVSNPFDEPIEVRLTAALPKGWKIAADGAPWNEPFAMEPGKPLPVDVTLLPGEENFSGIIDVLQHYRRKNMSDEAILGGMSFKAAARDMPHSRPRELVLMSLVEKHQLMIEDYQAMVGQLMRNRSDAPDHEQAALNQLGEILAAQGNLLNALAESQ